MISITLKTRKIRSAVLTLISVVTLFCTITTAKCQDFQQQSPSLAELGDRVVIKELVDAYARYADRREPEKQASLFTPDGEIEVFNGEPGKNKRSALIKGRKDLAAGFSILKQYDVTMHFNGQTTIVLNGDTAKGETYCLAHHIWKQKGKRMLLVMGIRYYDSFRKVDGKWFFVNRQLIFDWKDRRISHP